MSALQRLGERLNQSARYKPQDGDNTTDTSQEVNKTAHDMSENTGHSADVTQYKTWIQKIKENGNKPEDWLEITNSIKNSMSSGSWKTYISLLCMLYAKAMNAINLDMHKDNVAYAKLLVNFADVKSIISVEEARSLLHFARKNVKKHAIVHIAAAQLEVSSGSHAKAEQILEKALQLKAVPEEHIRTALQNLTDGKMALCPNQERNLYSNSKENIEQSLTDSVSRVSSANTDQVRNNTVKVSLTNSGKLTDFFEVAKSEMKTSTCKDSSLRSDELQPLGQRNQIQSSAANADKSGLSTKHDSCKDKSSSMLLTNIQIKTEVKHAFSASSSNASKPTLTDKSAESSETLSSLETSQPSASQQGCGGVNTSHSVSFEDSTVTFKNSKVTRNSELDDADTVPVPLDQEKGLYKKTLTSYNSTPDCKGPGFFSYFSTRKPGVLGKPRRVKRTSMPQLSESALVMDEDAGDQLPSPTEISNLKANELTEAEDVRMLTNSMTQEWERNDEPDVNDMSCDGNTSRQDSGVMTTTPEEVAPDLRTDASMYTANRSTGSTVSTLRPTVLQCFDNDSFNNKSSSVLHQNSNTFISSRHKSQSSQPRVSDAPSSGLVHSDVLPSSRSADMVVPSFGMLRCSGSASSTAMCPSTSSTSGVVPAVQNRPRDTLTVCGKIYTLLGILGRGGSSEVYNTLDSACQLRAIKCVNLSGADEVTFKSYMNEIKLLKRLQYSDRIIKLYDYEYVSREEVLYVVLERGDTDLAKIFREHNKSNSFDTLTQKYYWQEMLKAVQVLHNEGIVHSDLKPANFLFIAGRLKLIDFGIAKAIHQDKTSVTCEQAVGTLNYLSPEAIMETTAGMPVDVNGEKVSKIKIGVKSDVWSLGCILYNMVYGRSPFHHISNSIAKLHAITNPKVEISFPESADPTLRRVLIKCLQRDPKLRPSVKELLAYEY